jgi:hypothetical protein
LAEDVLKERYLLQEAVQAFFLDESVNDAAIPAVYAWN